MNKTPWMTLLPIGGLGEIGQNMTLIKGEREWVLIDTGILFPFEQSFNLQYLTPPLDEIEFPEDCSLIVTHAHEDHIGAIPHLLKKNRHIKVYASSFAKRVVERKLGHFQIEHPIEIYDEESFIHFEQWDIYPIHVNHSIPQTYGLLFRSHDHKLSCFFASDFKYDTHSPYEKPLPLVYIKQLMQKSTFRLLMLDSTNILSKDKTPSERELIKPLETLIKSRRQRTFITFFPSNIHRLQTIIHLAYKHHKKIVYCGRSLEFYTSVALQEKLLELYQETYFPLDEVSADVEQQSDLIILLTGCQGDFKGTLSRVINGYHPLFKLGTGDLILFSSKTIPGNEKVIGRLINKVYQQGGEVVTARDALIHTSGHASQEDLKKMIKGLKPTHYIPIHGENYFLHKHSAFVRTLSPQTEVTVLNNFNGLVISNDGKIATFSEEMKEPTLFIENGIMLERESLRARKKVAQNGLVIVAIAQTEGKQLQVKLEFIGLPQAVLKWQNGLITTIQQIVQNGEGDEEKIRAITRQLLKSHLTFKPEVQVIKLLI